MTLDEFSKPMERLRGTFGERFYSEARTLAFWEELRSTDAALWDAAVKRLVLDEAQPPMMKQIRMALAQEREKRHSANKITHAKESEDFFRLKTAGCPEELKNKFPHIFKVVPKDGGGV